MASIFVAYMSTSSCWLWRASAAPVLKLARVGQLCQFLLDRASGEGQRFWKHSQLPLPLPGKHRLAHMPLVVLNLFILSLLPVSIWFRLVVIWHWAGCGKCGMKSVTPKESHLFPSWCGGQDSCWGSGGEGGCEGSEQLEGWLPWSLSERPAVPGYRCKLRLTVPGQ